jgi:hypothetical protein
MAMIKPSEVPMKPGMISSHIESKQPLNANYIKVPEPVRKITYSSGGKVIKNHPLHVDYNNFSSQAANLLIRELEKNGVPLSSNAHKTIKVVVTNLEIEGHRYSFVFWAHLDLEAETGDGNICKLRVSNSGGTMHRASGGAITRGIAELLNNRDIISYIQGTSVEEKDPYRKLEKLKQMRDGGLITEDEYNNKKNEILKRL